MRFRCLLALTVALTAPRLSAQALDERALPPEIASEVTGLFAAPGTWRIEGRHEVAAGEEVRRDLVVLDGPLVVSGRIIGRVIAVNATVELRTGGSIDGDLLIVGGSLIGRDVGTLTGAVRTYSTRVRYAREGDRLTVREREAEDERWWRRRRENWRNRGWGDLRLVSARTYNRVEGLPIQFGPVFGREFEWGRLSVDALGILRSADSFEWTPQNVGHTAKAEVRLGQRQGVRFGARHFDIVDPVESWQMSDTEVGLASFFLHRDFRDYFSRHGGSVFASVFQRKTFDLGASYSHQRWATRDTRDPWTLFRDTDSWRANPQTDEGKFHIANATLRMDTRNDERNPWTGWLVTADYEYGNGTIARYAPTSPGARDQSPGGATTYDRLFVDVRRYNRIAPGAQINFRLAAGGWLSGDDLPLQRRFGLGGPGTMPGFDFRRLMTGPTDHLMCSAGGTVGSALPMGRPGECERMALAQVEFRGDFDIDPFGILDEDRNWRRRGWGRGAQWVVFADAGRGWLVGTPDRARTYGKSEFPALSTFQTDVGFGLLLDDLGLYMAKAVSQSKAPVNFFVRLRPRF